MKPLMIVAGLLGLVLLAVSYVYFTTPANSLPSFLPGYDPNLTVTHMKHGIGALFLGLACFAFAWFQSKPKASSGPQPEQ